MNVGASLLGAFLLAAGVVGACSSDKTEAPPTQTTGGNKPSVGSGSGGAATPIADAGSTTVTEPDGAVVKVCNSTTCMGCCDAIGNCQEGNLVTQCGVNGNPCLVCTSSQTTCINGLCE